MKKRKFVRDPMRMCVCVWFTEIGGYRSHKMKFTRCKVSEAREVASAFGKFFGWQIDLITYSD